LAKEVLPLKHVAGTQPLLDTPWQELLARMSQDLRNSPHPGICWAMPENHDHASAIHRRHWLSHNLLQKPWCRTFVARCNDFTKDFH